MTEVSGRRVAEFISSLERALNGHDAVAYNRFFAKDVSWGNPNGGLVSELASLHSVHKSFLEGPLRTSRFRLVLERAELIGSECAFAHCRLTRTNADGTVIESDERCLYVLELIEGQWWLRAGHNTRIQSVQARPEGPPAG